MGDDEHYLDEPEAAPERQSLASRGCGYLGCALLIALLIALGAGLYFGGRALEPLADKFLWQPHELVREYFAAYRDGDTERAQRFLCQDVSGLLDPYAPLGRRTGNAHVDDELPYPRAGGRLAIYYRAEQHGPRAQALLEREDDGWRICAFE